MPEEIRSSHALNPFITILSNSTIIQYYTIQKLPSTIISIWQFIHTSKNKLDVSRFRKQIFKLKLVVVCSCQCTGCQRIIQADISPTDHPFKATTSKSTGSSSVH